MHAQRKKPESAPKSNRAERTPEEASVRIVGGEFRGRKLLYSGDARTRPMKNRVREALFNLIGPEVKGMHAVDLFAGTGALGLEAISRGAAGGTLIERHFPTADLIRQNVTALGATPRCQVVAADAFLWLKRDTPPLNVRWLVLCSPPFELYETKLEALMELLAEYIDRAPSGSIVAVEVPDTFDLGALPHPDAWQTRMYAPVQVALLSKP